MERWLIIIQVVQSVSLLMALLLLLVLHTTMAMEMMVGMFVYIKTTTGLGSK